MTNDERSQSEAPKGAQEPAKIRPLRVVSQSTTARLIEIIESIRDLEDRSEGVIERLEINAMPRARAGLESELGEVQADLERLKAERMSLIVELAKKASELNKKELGQSAFDATGEKGRSGDGNRA